MRKQIPRKYEDLLPSAQKQQQTNIKKKKKKKKNIQRKTLCQLDECMVGIVRPSNLPSI